MAGVLMLLLAGCSKSPRLNLRLSNPSGEMQMSDIQVFLDGKSLTGTTKPTLGPNGEQEYRRVQIGSGELQLTYRYADANTPSQFKTNLATQFGAKYSGTIQITFSSSDDIDIREVTD
jgi:hypothetical protein